MSVSAWGGERDAHPHAQPAKAARRSGPGAPATAGAASAGGAFSVVSSGAGPGSGPGAAAPDVRVVQLSRVEAHGNLREVLTLLGFEAEFQVHRRGKRYAVPARGALPSGVVEVFRLHGPGPADLYAARGSDQAVPWIVHARFTVPKELEPKASALADAVAAWMRALRPFVETVPGA